MPVEERNPSWGAPQREERRPQQRYFSGRAWNGGRRWIAKTAAEWASETNLSVPQYHRALRVLKDQGPVLTEQHIFTGRSVTYLRPITYVGLGELATSGEG